MEAPSAIEAARHLLSVIWGDPVPADADISKALDRLLAEYQNAPEGVASDVDVEPPDRDWNDLYQQVAKRFPDYGFYPTVDPLGSVDQAVMMGDAVDDLADITSDLREVLWQFENFGVDDAHWCLQLYYFHWGLHARNLALYLHARQFG